MPRSRGSETPQQPQPQPQRQSPRAPLHLRTTNSESNGVHTHHRSSPKLEDNHRRSPRSPLREFSSCNQKKRVSKVTDLETKLGHVQDELRKLREQLASAEAAKRDAQHELEEAKKKLAPTTPPAAGDQAVEEPHIAAEVHQNTQEKDGKLAAVDTVLQLEVDSNSDAMEEKNEGSEVIDGEASKGEAAAAAAAAAIVEADEAKPKETQEKADMCALEARLEEKVKELERCLAENATLKQQLAEAEASAAAARAREEDTGLKLAHAMEELEASRAKAGQLGEQLEAAEGGKSSLEAEMKKLKVQTEQWRKAADAAVAALSVTGGLGAEPNGRRVSERCGSMDKHLYAAGGELGSPLVDEDSDEGWGGASGRARGCACSGICGRRKASTSRRSQLLLLVPVLFCSFAIVLLYSSILVSVLNLKGYCSFQVDLCVVLSVSDCLVHYAMKENKN